MDASAHEKATGPHGSDAAYNYAYLDEQTKRMIRRAILKAVAVPGYQVPFGGREMPLPYGWGTGGIQVTAAIIGAQFFTSFPEATRNVFALLAFCHGVLAGAYGYFLSSTPAADRFVCPPPPAPTRSQVSNGFVAWMKANPQYSKDGAIDALFAAVPR